MGHEKHAVEQILGQLGIACGPYEADRQRLLAGTVTDPEERCEILFSKAHDLLTGADYEVLFGDPDPLVRLVAAYFAAVMLMDNCPRSALPVIVDSLERRAELGPRLDALELAGTGLILVYLARALNNVTAKDDEASRRFLPVLAAAIPDTPDNVRPILVKAVFGLAFGNCQPPFTDGFLALLDGVLAAELPAQAAHDRGLADAFSSFGLPTDREQLAGLVARLRGEPQPAVALSAYMRGAR